MVSRKENLSFEEVSSLVVRLIDILKNDNIKEDEAFYAVRLLGIINGSAFKGYGDLTEEQFEYNRYVYYFKKKFLRELIKIYIKNNWDISKGPDVVFFRSSNGIQVSFHLKNINVDLHGVKKGKWDGVFRSYLYEDAINYNIAKELSEEDYNKFLKKEESYRTKAKEIAIAYLKHPARRKRLGIFVSYSELQKFTNESFMLENFTYTQREEIMREIESKIGKWNSSDYIPTDYTSTYAISSLKKTNCKNPKITDLFFNYTIYGRKIYNYTIYRRR